MDRKLDFYDSFSCVADRCSFTCCQQWKIAVDTDTYCSWQGKSLGDRELTELVVEQDGGKVICLDDKKKCPYLQENLLCSLVCQYGEEILSKTCHTFPRQIHEFEDRTEYSLVSCCPVVIDFLPQKELIHIDSISQRGDKGFLHLRTKLMEHMLDEDIPVEKAMLLNVFLLLDVMEKWERQGEVFDAGMEALGKQETLVEKLLAKWDKEVILDAFEEIDTDEIDRFCECNEIFLDLVDNYRKEGIYEEQIEPLAMIAEDFEAVFGMNEEDAYEEEAEEESDGVDAEIREINLTEADILRAFRRFTDEMEEYDRLLRNVMCNDLFSDFLLPESTLLDLVVMAEWKSLCFATLRQMLFLRWFEKRSLSYEDVRECVVVLERMTGYEAEDIEEYLKNSFESLIWPLGYAELIL